jgi:Bacterial Ig-like domain
MEKRIVFGGGVVGALVAMLLGAVVGCGDEFSNGDCHANRTCSAAAGASVDGGSPSGANDGDATTVVGGDATAGGDTATGGDTTGTAGGDAAAISGGAGTMLDGGAGAGGVAGNAPPRVTAVSPEDQGSKADPDGNIVIEFSEPLLASTVSNASIKILDGDVEVEGTVKYADSKVTFTPAVPLYFLEGYKVSVASTVADVDGVAMLAPFTSTFTTRDGAWKTIDAVADDVTAFANALPISEAGNVLLAWHGSVGAKCPASAQLFRFAAGVGTAKAFDANDTVCSDVAAAGNAAGVGAVLWRVPGASAGELAQQLRKGAWQATNAVVSNASPWGLPALAVSPTGMVTAIVHKTGGGSTAFRTDAAGKWVATGDNLSADVATSPASIAFDASGNGLAVWAALTVGNLPEMLYSRYLTASGKWGPASVVPDQAAKYALSDYAPTLAMTPDGDAMAVWMQVQTDVGTQVNTSLFSRISGWQSSPYSLQSYLAGFDEAPGLAYDGEAFTAAWVDKPFDAGVDLCGKNNCTWFARYDLQRATWGVSDVQQKGAADVAAPKMPRLVSDGRGNSLLVWAKPAATANNFTLVYQRYTNGKWGAITPLPGGSVADKAFAQHPLPLSMNASGMAALAWGNYDSSGLIPGIRLASFF